MSKSKLQHWIFKDEEYDGFGTWATKCARADCDAQIVRPGKTQCRGETDDQGCQGGPRPHPLDILAAHFGELQEEIHELHNQFYLSRRVAGDDNNKVAD